MTERIITLDEIDPIDIYGVNNKLIDLLSSYFPKMKIVARGSEIFLHGSISDIKKFEEKLNVLKEIRGRKSRLNEDDINNLFDGSSASKDTGSDDKDIIVYGTDGKIIRARTKNQKKLVASYYDTDLIFAVGPAGTGKTYTAIALAVRALKNKEVKKLILTRPAVEAGERLGFLPGDLREKLDPYLQPLYDALRDMLPAKKLQTLMEEGVIQIAPLAYMRGRTLDSAFVILDEAQNTTLGQLKMFLTRMGCNAKFIVTGDVTQIDLPKRSDSGLVKGMKLCSGIRGVTLISFGKEDIVRHPLVSKIVNAFEKSEENGERTD
ncbi:MAG: PhoH family protein [Rikenellaceae bacterium]